MPFNLEEIQDSFAQQSANRDVHSIGFFTQNGLTEKLVFRRYAYEDWQSPDVKKVLMMNMTKHPLLEKAIPLLVLGFSIREVSKLVKLDKNTVMKLSKRLRLIVELKCPCGSTSGHKGWCKWKFSRSAKRALFMEKIHKKQRERCVNNCSPLNV